MPIDNYFKTPFALDGDKTDVPDAPDPGGAVSYDQGYPADYALPTSDPDRRAIEREKMNDIFYEITLALKQYQENGTPPFITPTANGGSPYSYSMFNRVLYNGVAYWSLTNSNTDTPPSANWATVNIYNPILITMGADPVAPLGSFNMDGTITIAQDNTNTPTNFGVQYLRLFNYLWNLFDNTNAPVLPGGRGVSAAADWAAKKTIGIPDRRGYSPFGIKAASIVPSASTIAGTLTQAAAGSLNMSSVNLTASNMAPLNITMTVGDVNNTVNTYGASGDNSRVDSVTSFSTNAGGAGFTPAGSFAGSPTTILHPVMGVYYYINY